MALSLDNLLIQFFMAVHDRMFMPILGAAVIAEAVLIVLFHQGVGQIVADVLGFIDFAVYVAFRLGFSVRRLAMEVEDHPISYNTFEGTIPAGEYGGGTVMLWDQGTYEAEDGGGVESLRRGYEKGDLKIVLHGKRLKGAWVLVRMKRPGRPQWLLIKHRDGTEDSGRDLTEKYTTSVVSRRSMDSIAAGRGSAKVWRSNR